jgi:hypothetical protein
MQAEAAQQGLEQPAKADGIRHGARLGAQGQQVDRLLL